MRWMIVAMLVGCGGTYVCHSPCVGGSEQTVYLCDGAQCPTGEANAVAYVQCVCGSGHSLIVAEPATPTACRELKTQWDSFWQTNCR